MYDTRSAKKVALITGFQQFGSNFRVLRQLIFNKFLYGPIYFIFDRLIM
jgi:hypothetical protein